MNPIQHPSNNHAFGPPPGLDQDVLPCETLHVTACRGSDGLPVMISFWQPTLEEIQHLVSGGAVMLYVYGTQHPVVAVGAEPLTGLDIALVRQ